MGFFSNKKKRQTPHSFKMTKEEILKKIAEIDAALKDPNYPASDAVKKAMITSRINLEEMLED